MNKYCVLMREYGTMRPAETVLRRGERGIMKKDGRGESI
jgi:hypothetical protein